MSDDVSVQRHDEHIGVVTLRRPPNNYFDTSLIEAVGSAYDELDGSSWCRAIVLAAEGKHFCAGLDFSANANQDIAALYRAALRLFAAPLPVVAAVQGAAIGGGFGLALSTDFRVATPESRFSANFARLGFHHGFALTVTLPATVGRQAATDLLLTGRRVGGEEAMALGLCDRLTDRDQLLAAGARLRRGAGGVGPAGRALHPGHAAARPGGAGRAGHGARVRRADAPGGDGGLPRGSARRGRATHRPLPRRVSMDGPALHELNTAFTWSDHRGRSASSAPSRPASTTSAGSSCSRTR